MAYLVAINGLDVGRVLELQDGWNSIGRQPDCQVFLQLDSVSRHHATIRIDGEQAQLEDLSSRNGTLVNARGVQEPMELADGDVIQFGQVEFRFQLQEPAARPLPSGTRVIGSEATAAGQDRNDYGPVATPDMLRLRAQLLGRLREFFAAQDFLEVETPLASADTTVERHIEPVPVTIHGRSLWLQTSPEFAMKRLLTNGVPAIYQVTRAFRDGELGACHNPEFTIVEWYRTRDTMEQAMDFLGSLCQHLLATPLPRQLSYREAFQQYLDLDPFTVTDRILLKRIAGLDVTPPDDWRKMDRDSWLNLLLADFVEPHLGMDGPTILHGYPPSQAALAQVRPGSPPVAERFELYLNGLELANGYHELLDAQELLRRSQRSNQERLGDGNQVLPENSYLQQAMEAGLPDCCGVALGFDRLVMLAAGADSIEQVLTFPFDRA
mgnify:CR=1 FL=1